MFKAEKESRDRLERLQIAREFCNYGQMQEVRSILLEEGILEKNKSLLPIEYIVAADLAAVPLTSGGGTKLKMLEYMASGKAIVSTFKAAEGLGLENGKDVLMTENTNSEFLGLIFRLIENVKLRKKIGMAARKKAEQFYDWTNTAKKAAKVYACLLHSR